MWLKELILHKRCVKIDEYYTNIYGHERLWLKQWAQGDCNCAIFTSEENSTIAVTEGP